MPITFGSVGDIVSVCLLVKDLVDALDRIRGSKAEYQSLIRELWILDRVLLEVDLLARTHGDGSIPELKALCETARKAVERCRDLVGDFQQKLKKYQSSFDGTTGQPKSVFKNTVMKVRWRIDERDAVERFRVAIAGTSNSLQMLLASASVNLIDINGKRVSDKLGEIESRGEANRTHQEIAILEVQSQLKETNKLVAMGNAATTSIADAIRLDWLRNLGAELKGFMRRIMAMNITTYHAMLNIQVTLPSRMERGLIEEPFILEDAIGRIAPVHLQFVTSWDAFHAVMETRFQNIQGYKKVQQRQYGLQERATKRDIDHSRPWQGAFLPGQVIEMSFLFDRYRVEVRETSEVTCPNCQYQLQNPASTEMQCPNCNIWFRRITIVQKSEPEPHPTLPTPWKLKSEFGKSGFSNMVLGPVRPGKKRVSPGDIEGEDDLGNFKRIRLIEKREMVRNNIFGHGSYRQNTMSFSEIRDHRAQVIKNTVQDEHTSAGMETGNNTQTKKFESMITATANTPSCAFACQSASLISSTEEEDPASIVRLQLEHARKSGLFPPVRPLPGSREAPIKSYVRYTTVDPSSNPLRMAHHVQQGAAETNKFRPSQDMLDPSIEPYKVMNPLSSTLYSRISILRSLKTAYSVAEPIATSNKHRRNFGVLDPNIIWQLSKSLLRYRDSNTWPDFFGVHGMIENTFLADLEPFGERIRHQEHQPPAFDKDSLWPSRPFTIVLAQPLMDIYGTHAFDCWEIPYLEHEHGMRYEIPRAQVVFSGSSIGRWLFDWAFEHETGSRHPSNWLVCFAHDLWGRIFQLEEYSRSQPIRYLVGGTSDGQYSEPMFFMRARWKQAGLSRSHFIVSYNCFRFQLTVFLEKVISRSGYDRGANLGDFMKKHNARILALTGQSWFGVGDIGDHGLERLLATSLAYVVSRH